MQKSCPNNLMKKQKEAIAEQLASFFFDFWNNRNVKEQKIENQKEENVRIPHKN